MDLDRYFDTFHKHLFEKYSGYLPRRQYIVPHTRQYYLQQLMIQQNSAITIINIDDDKHLQIGTHQHIELTKGQSCLMFRKTWRSKRVIRLADYDELEDEMYRLQSRRILNDPEYFCIRGGDYDAFFFDSKIDEIDPRTLANSVWRSQARLAELDEQEYQCKLKKRLVHIGLRESEIIEFKRGFPESAREIAKEMVAFANSDGGTMYLGIDDDGFIIGVDNPQELDARICGIARNNCQPPVHPRCNTESHARKEVLVVSIGRSTHVHRTNDGRFYKRVGTNAVEMSVEELEALILERRKDRNLQRAGSQRL